MVPAFNEAECLPALVAEFDAAMQDAQVDAELIAVDDGSTDDTVRVLHDQETEHPWLRVVTLPQNAGQSAAFAAGIRAARGPHIGMLDADGQNDPADLPRLLQHLRQTDADLVQGQRTDRQDSTKKRLASTIGRAARRWALGDRVADTGCSCRVATAELARSWPLHLRGMHRFIPALSAMHGARVVEIPVAHRPRRAGRSKYRDLARGLPGFFDLLAVQWMQRRHVRLPDAAAPARDPDSVTR